MSLSSIPLIIIYPLAKRFTKWPQIVLGLTFSWAVPTAWSSANEEWNLGILMMYFATVFWVIGYDTIYGCQDKNEDEVLGIKNSAVSAKNFLNIFVGSSYAITFLLLMLSGYLLNTNNMWYVGVFLCGFHFTNQVVKLKKLENNNPLNIFKSNAVPGLILTISALSNYLTF